MTTAHSTPPSTSPSGESLPRRWRRPPMIVKARWLRWALLLGAVAYLIIGVGSVEVNWSRVLVGLERGQRFVAGFLQPDFTTRWGAISQGLREAKV